MEYRGLLSMPEIIPASSMQQLSSDGINFIKKVEYKALPPHYRDQPTDFRPH